MTHRHGPIALIALLASLCVVPSPSLSSTATGGANAYSLTISGGISLGAYEAGVNWVLIEVLRDAHVRSGGKEFDLDVVTGASAGAINAVIAGLRFCEDRSPSASHSVVDNLFFETWDIGLNDLLPNSSGHYDSTDLKVNGKAARAVHDSLFSRKILETKISNMSDYIDERRYRPGCEVDIALLVTRSTPESIDVETTPTTRKLAIQRFLVPLTLSVSQDEGDLEPRVRFGNNHAYAHRDNKADSRYIFLPELDGSIDFEVVARAVLASSAFPIAFGSVELDYCYPNENEPLESGSEYHCPAGHRFRTNHFVDGGIFDNAPIGAAVELAGKTPAEDAGRYIYLDPDNTAESLQVADIGNDEGSLTLIDQLSVLMTALNNLRSQRLTRTLAEDFVPYVNRKLLVSRRSLPITGTYLGGFGAFVDKAFFYYDYAAGVHDGIMNVADYLCETPPDSESRELVCTEGKFKFAERIRISYLPKRR